jgi:hypothetical protein
VKRVGDALSVRTYHLDRGIEPGVLWSWYAIGRTPAAGPMQAKLLEVGHAAIFSRPGATIFTIAAWGDSRRTATELVLEDAARDVWTWYLQQ